MELRQLRYFLMVAETLHFGRAAAQLHISQQPLSFQIKQLEEELGAKLFERTTRSVALTPAGEAMLAEVRAGLNRIDRGMELAQRIARGEQGKLMVGYTINTLCSVMPPIIRQFRERFPHIELVLLELTPPVLERQLLNEDIDIGIVSSIGTILPGLALQRIYQETGAVALPKNHPLAHQAAVSLRELASEPFVMYSRQTHRELFDDLISLCRLAGFSPTIVQEAANEAALISLVAAGLGVALVSSSLRNLLPDEVIYCPLVEPAVKIEVALEWKENRHLPWLAELRKIAQEVKKLMVINEH